MPDQPFLYNAIYPYYGVVPDIIAKKRDGGTLDHEELSFAVNGYVAGDVPDYQMSALLIP